MVDLVQEAINHLKTNVPVLKGKVSGVDELEEAIASTKYIAPYFYVIYLAEEASSNERVTGIAQRVSVKFGIVYAIPNGSNPLGIKASNNLSQLQIYREPVINAVLGWQADAHHDPSTFKNGFSVQVQGKTLWWQDVFETAFYRFK